MKPDVVAPGSGINAPRHQEGSLQLPNQPRPLADNEYQELDGTSMATPHVSGLIAIMLGIDDSLDLVADCVSYQATHRNGAILLDETTAV